MVERFEIPEKPDYLPIHTEEGLQNLEFLTLPQQEECERYLRYLGGQNVREACNFSLRAAVTDEAMRNYTYGGVYDEVTGEIRRRAFQGTMLSNIIQRSLNGRKFDPPNLLTFQSVMMDVIGLSHQRLRTQRNAAIRANQRIERLRRGRPPANENNPA